MEIVPMEASRSAIPSDPAPDPALPGERTAVSWTLPHDLSFDRWLSIGETLNQIERSVQWWLGDWWNYGERKWNEDAAQALDGFKNPEQTIQNIAYVARRFRPLPPSEKGSTTVTPAVGVVIVGALPTRHENLSFSHHQEVAGLVDKAPQEAQRLLDLAEQEKWNKYQLREEVQRSRAALTLPAYIPEPDDDAGIDLRCADVADMLGDLPRESASLIHVDPPWRYDNYSEPAHGASAAYYDGLPESEIAAAISRAYRVAAPNSYLAVWCTFPKLAEWMDASLHHLGGWEYVTGGAWAKTGMNSGLGKHFMGQIELLLLYRKGKPVPLIGAKPNLWSAPRQGHSVKPQVALRHLVEMSTPRGGLVVDLYAGASASMALACRALERRYAGAEIDEVRHRQALLYLHQTEMRIATPATAAS